MGVGGAPESLNIELVGAVYDRPNQVRKDRAVGVGGAPESLNIELVGAVYDRPNQVRKDRAVVDRTYSGSGRSIRVALDPA